MTAPTSTKYRDESALREAVMEEARIEWRIAAGRDLSEYDLADFQDRQITDDERRSIELTRLLVNVLKDVAAFARDHSGNPILLEPPGTQNLRTFVDRYMPFLVGGAFSSSDGEPSILEMLAPADWSVTMRGRVIVLLRDRLRYWENFGLREPAGSRTMACASFLLGSFPLIDRRVLAGDGISIEEVFQKEMACIRAEKTKVDRLPMDGNPPTARR